MTRDTHSNSGVPWRSLDELAGMADFKQSLKSEFPAGAAWLDEVESGSTTLRRRRFMQLMGASFGVAGLTNCGRQPVEKIVPYVEQPENLLPGDPSYYASAVSFRGHARGILVKSDMGRPTKIEGNPDHPSSLGATDAQGQAAVLDLYDPDRARAVKQGANPSTWSAFENAHRVRRELHKQNGGSGYAVLIEPTTSPTLQRLLAELLVEMPRARIYQHTPYSLRAPEVLADFSKADVIVSMGEDFLADHPESLRFARQFAERRRAGGDVSRLYVIESTWSLTGAMADHRLLVKPSRIAQLARNSSDPHTTAESDFFKMLAAEPKSANKIVRGDGPAIGQAVPPTLTDFPDLASLSDAISAGEIETLVILGGNPAYTAAGPVDFAAALRNVDFTAHLASHENETSALCEWRLPETHFLETWGDIRSFEGRATVQQPLIEPLYLGRSAVQILAPDRQPRDLVRETYQQTGAIGDAFETLWRTMLRDGITPPDYQLPAAAVPYLTSKSPAPPPEPAEIELITIPSPHVSAGEFANNGWMQELPQPFTKLVWDNAALVAPAFAKRHDLENGDVIAIRKSNSPEIEAPVWILPGQADGTITAHLGYGRERAGELGTGVGFDAFPLTGRSGETIIRKTGRKHKLISTQNHSSMEGRELIWRLTAADAAKGDFPNRPPAVPEITLYTDPKAMLNGRHAWAMSIDLSTCIGCNACITACQAENNIPVVGKSEVARGREMHWIRLDRYFIGDDENDPALVHQPVTCQHCEQAPCEVVCPVEATVHTADGINAMVYNRCVGTRYCSNNCPYKVRRFNFFDYRTKSLKSDPRSLQANPDVTVRGRGVMEKCSYCIQRIQRAVIGADRDNRRVRDGEILTACQQACPAQAIIFGDLKTNGSKVSVLRNGVTAYSLLGNLNTRPRTTYLAKIVNPHV